MSLDDLRAALSEQITSVRDGNSSPAVANAITGAVGTYLRSVKLEIEYYRMTGKTPTIPLLEPKPADAPDE